jgi:hypothetical protein
MTSWRLLRENELKLLRSIDMSALPLTTFATCAAPAHSVFLEVAVLPVTLRVIPWKFLAGCWRLKIVDTTACSALEEIQYRSFTNCRSLREFWFPPTVREVDGTAITCIDLSETRAESAGFSNTTFLERVILPRRCVLAYAYGLPSLRSLTIGVFQVETPYAFRMPSIRLQSMKSVQGRELVGGGVSAEVAAVRSRGSSPCSPL